MDHPGVVSTAIPRVFRLVTPGISHGEKSGLGLGVVLAAVVSRQHNGSGSDPGSSEDTDRDTSNLLTGELS